jgi:RHS repeat-associated protein
LGTEAGGVTNRLQEQAGYFYDYAGNLQRRTNNALVDTFNVNDLTELTTNTHAGTLTVAGTTTSAATNVTVNGLTASVYQDSTFAKDGFTVTNGINSFTAVARDSLGRQDSSMVSVNLPTAVIFSYDLNGNLLSDGTRAFDYDDENQLIRITVTNAWKSEFTYDGRMRCRVERNFAWTGSAWQQTNEVRFVYDGNVIIQHRDGNNLPTLTLTRGLDLGGSLQSAGGIGGILAMSESSAVNPQHSYFHSDGNGNVTALINGLQLTVARYLYDPFGNMLSISGPKSFLNRYRFSSKPIHDLSGTYDFLYRRYVPELQRWLNRDPIEEFGGLNLYTFIENLGPDAIDSRGLDILINRSGVPLLIDGNPGQGHGTGGFMFAVCPPDNTQHGGTNPIPCYATAAAAWTAYSNAAPTTNFIYDVDGWYDSSGTRHRIRGDDQGPVTTIGRDKNGKECEKNRSGRLGALWRYIWR